ncbi:MAG: hypothetical protein HYX96_03770 [Chloroflexi bacterium]|nr:hypothetical protein [Chloroflexota bacterium]
MKCATHPAVESNLRCGKCSILICPKCMVQTPVGARCRQCAQVQRLPTYTVSLPQLVRAAGAALVSSIVIGIAWGFLDRFIPFFFLNLLLAAAAGYAIGEITSLSVNRKRGRSLAAIAALALVLSFAVHVVVRGGLFLSPLGLLLNLAALVLGVLTAVNRLR